MICRPSIVFKLLLLDAYASGGPEVVEVEPDGAPDVLAGVFGVDPDLYREAEAVRKRYGRSAG